MMIPTAKIIDNVSPKIMLIFGFLQRAVFNYSYFYMNDPTNIMFYIVAPFYHYGIFFL